MFQKFYPSEYYTSTYVIDFAEYYKKGYRGILFDIDNTLVPHNAPATKEAIRLIHRLKEIGFGICLVSNNKEPRVAEFNKPLDVKYIYKAKTLRLPESHAASRHRYYKYSLCRRPVVYRSLGRK